MNADHLCQIEHNRTRAIVDRDLEAIIQLHAPEYELVTPSGRVLSRDRYIQLIAEAPFYSAWQLGPMQARVSPAMGAVKYRARLVFPSGKVIECWHTDFYELRGEVWQAVWSQATELRAETNAGSTTNAA
jgi:hypothetical protein